MERKESFLERLTGTRKIVDDHDMAGTIRPNHYGNAPDDADTAEELEDYADNTNEEESFDEEAGVAIDMYETDNEIVIQSMIAGVTPENLHISITRDTVLLRGKRTELDIPEENYLTRELYWGSFSREIELPYEIDTDGAEAVEKYGLLIIRLPKLDIRKTAELKVKSM